VKPWIKKKSNQDKREGRFGGILDGKGGVRKTEIGPQRDANGSVRRFQNLEVGGFPRRFKVRTHPKTSENTGRMNAMNAFKGETYAKNGAQSYVQRRDRQCRGLLIEGCGSVQGLIIEGTHKSRRCQPLSSLQKWGWGKRMPC